MDPAEARLRDAVARPPRDPQAHAALGRYSLGVGRPASALWYLETARSLESPEAPALRRDQARALEHLGQRSLAVAELRALPAASPAEAEARAQLAELLLTDGRPEEALAVLRAAGKSAPAAAETTQLLGQVYHALGQLPAAEEAFRRAARLAGAETARHLPLGRFLLASGRPDEARQALMQDQRVAFRTAEFHYLLGLTYLRAQPRPDLDKAAAAFTVALRFDPRHAGAPAALGQVLERQGAKEEAVAQYEAAIRADPTLPEPHVRLAALSKELGQTVPAFQQQGIAATLRDQLPEAEAAFRRMLDADPGNLGAAQSLILTCVAMQRVDRARPAVEALQRQPFDPQTAERVGQLYLMTGSRPACRRLAEDWRQREPKAAGPLRLLARLAVDDLRVTEGIRLYEQAWQREPDHAGTAASLGLAWARVPSRPNLERAHDWLLRAVALAPDDAQYADHLGRVQQQLGRHSGARDSFLRALDRDPSLSSAASSLVRLAQQSGQPDNARLFGRIVRALDETQRQKERLRRQVLESPGDAAARLALARFHLSAGELEKARYHLEHAVALRPGLQPARTLHRTVEALLVWK